MDANKFINCGLARCYTGLISRVGTDFDCPARNQNYYLNVTQSSCIRLYDINNKSVSADTENDPTLLRICQDLFGVFSIRLADKAVAL